MFTEAGSGPETSTARNAANEAEVVTEWTDYLRPFETFVQPVVGCWPCPLDGLRGGPFLIFMELEMLVVTRKAGEEISIADGLVSMPRLIFPSIEKKSKSC